MDNDDTPLTPLERCRRVVILCSSFVRNLAIYRSGQNVGKKLLAKEVPNSGFWRDVNSNCIDICVLEWCKLFADKHGEHYWRKAVAVERQADFEAGWLRCIDMNSDQLEEYIRAVRHYRDKFVAHLDSDRVMYPPVLGPALQSIRHLHFHVVSKECAGHNLDGLPNRPEYLDLGYEQCVREAQAVFMQASNPE